MEQAELLKYAMQVLQRQAIPHALVGSFASGIWGESRFTQDIDIVIELHSHQVAALCAEFPAEAFYVSVAAAQEAVRHRGQFNIIHPSSGNKIDFMVAGDTDWAQQQLKRCHQVCVFENLNVQVAAPEDVIIGKLIYYHEGGSDKHLRDIAGILKISHSIVDNEYIQRVAQQLGLASLWQDVLTQIKATDRP